MKGETPYTPDSHTVQSCCLAYGGSSFAGPMREALKVHYEILSKSLPVFKAHRSLEESCIDMLKWIEDHAGWEHGFSIDDLEQIKRNAQRAIDLAQSSPH